MAVEFDESEGHGVFSTGARGAECPGNGLFTMTTTLEALVCRIEASVVA